MSSVSLSIVVTGALHPRSRYHFPAYFRRTQISLSQKEMSSIAAFFSSLISTVHADAEQQPEAEVEEEAPEQPVAEQEEEEPEPEDVRPAHCLLLQKQLPTLYPT
jgi:hypothetical protein